MHPDKKSKKAQYSIEELKQIYHLRHVKKLDWADIQKEIPAKTIPSMRRKESRMNWKKFNEDPNSYEKNFNAIKRWSHEEMVQLDAFLQAGKSYDFIAEKLGRSITSVEGNAQHTDWQAWRKIKDAISTNGVAPADSFKDQLIGALLTICRYDFDRLKNVKEKQFLERINLEKDKMPISFDILREDARKELIILGFGNPESMDMKPGTYIILGDSHGKHTRKQMFSLLDHVNSTLKPDKIIHIGHILDDDNDISYDWGRYSNFVILSKAEELRIIQEQRNKFKFRYDIVRDDITIGDLIVNNQDLIADYVKTPISFLDKHIFDEKMIVNCHRLEFTTRCCNNSVSYFASPGCFCEKHIIKSIKQINFEDGRVVKQAYHDGFIKYRRMGHTNKYWELGLLVVHMDKQGNVTIVPCPIKNTAKGPSLSYFDKIITAKGVFKPQKKIFVNGDMHCDKHDVNVLDIQEKICKDYKPDVYVNVGDTFNYSSLNHHVMDRGGTIMNKKILDEASQVHYILKRCAKWAKESYLIYGNHERFADDFVEKYPQFGNYLDFKFLCNLDGLGYKLIPLKNVLRIASAKFVHGEMRMFGQSGSKMEKASRTFGRDVFIGHIHRPEIRFGCYSVGLAGELDQDYNEPEASNWLHGFGLCNQYGGQNFPTTIAIIDNKCVLNKKTYSQGNLSSWKNNGYEAHIVYEF